MCVKLPACNTENNTNNFHQLKEGWGRHTEAASADTIHKWCFKLPCHRTVDLHAHTSMKYLHFRGCLAHLYSVIPLPLHAATWPRRAVFSQLCSGRPRGRRGLSDRRGGKALNFTRRWYQKKSDEEQRAPNVTYGLKCCPCAGGSSVQTSSLFGGVWQLIWIVLGVRLCCLTCSIFLSCWGLFLITTYYPQWNFISLCLLFKYYATQLIWCSAGEKQGFVER